MDNDIEEVKKAIEKVEQDILGTERELKESVTGADVAHLRKEKEQLREEKRQLREKELLLLRAELSGPYALSMVQRKDPMKEMLAEVGGVDSIPGIDQLAAFLTANPLQSGFPISNEFLMRLSCVNSKGMFAREESGRLCKRLDARLCKVLEPPSTGSTEDSFHQFWDELINDFVQLFCIASVYHDRNTTRNASSGALRPDVIGVLGGQWALWRAEEKAPGGTGNPKEELVEKLTWIYVRVPYILAYHARGTLVTFSALYMQDGTKRIRNLCTYDLSTLDGRADILVACLNVGRLLPRLSSLCEDLHVDAEFQVLPERGGKLVKLYGRVVKKSYQSKDVFDHVVIINERIRGCPHIERIVNHFVKDDDESNWHSIIFEPRCDRSRRARPEYELVKALVCVAEALVWLHARSLMHRDIRWSNIAQFQGEWILLDFDEACVSPQSQAHTRLCPVSHAPETRTGGHDCTVDIWGIGHLIKTSRVKELVPRLIELQNRCLNGNRDLRPSAQNCLQELRSLIHDGIV